MNIFLFPTRRRMFHKISAEEQKEKLMQKNNLIKREERAIYKAKKLPCQNKKYGNKISI